MDAVRRRRERKILKIYRTPDWSKNPKLVHRLRCLEQAEANAIQRNFEKSMPDMAKFDEDLRLAKELLEKHGSEDPEKLSECFARVDTPEGRRMLAEYLASGPFPHYEAVPENPSLLIRIESDGTRILGRFVGREWVPHESEQR